MLHSFSPLMRRTELLIIFAPHLHLLLPQWILANVDRSDALIGEQVHDATAGRVQIGVDPAITLRRDLIQLLGGLAVLCGEFTLDVSTLLVVVVIEVFERATIVEPWYKALF